VFQCVVINRTQYLPSFSLVPDGSYRSGIHERTSSSTMATDAYHNRMQLGTTCTVVLPSS
jgi:hypothetical protein